MWFSKSRDNLNVWDISFPTLVGSILDSLCVTLYDYNIYVFALKPSIYFHHGRWFDISIDSCSGLKMKCVSCEQRRFTPPPPSPPPPQGHDKHLKDSSQSEFPPRARVHLQYLHVSESWYSPCLRMGACVQKPKWIWSLTPLSVNV